MPDTAPVPVSVTPAALPTPVKPGWKTSEFAGHAAAMLLTLLFASGLLTSSTALNVAGIAAAWLGSLGYTVNRTLLKSSAALMLFCLVASSQTACSGSTERRAAAGVTAFLDCEGSHVDPAMLADAKVLATSAASKWVSGSGKIDAAGLKADAAPLKTDLLRCAFDAAMAALATPVPATPGAPASSAMAVDARQVLATWTQVRGELAWPPRGPS